MIVAFKYYKFTNTQEIKMITRRKLHRCRESRELGWDCVQNAISVEREVRNVWMFWGLSWSLYQTVANIKLHIKPNLLMNKTIYLN